MKRLMVLAGGLALHLSLFTLPAHAVEVIRPASVPPATSFTANVDRTRLGAGETFDLTLESNDVTLFGKPDLSALQDTFDVLGTRQVNRLTKMGDNTLAATRWIVTLLPKRSGTLVIPALHIGKLSSQPITLQVADRSNMPESARQAPVYIESSFDAPSVYVQAQAVLTLRIYHSVSLYDDSSLSALQVPDARIEQLGDPRTYEKVIDGKRHGVIEVRYAIFPQHSGQIQVAPQVFSATLVEPRASGEHDRSPAGQLSRPGKNVRISSRPLTLVSKPQPANYPGNAPWLPASNVSLSEAWSPAPEHGQVGDALTRSVTLKAEGLASVQLPPLPASAADGLRRYPDQPQLLNQNTERGLLGSREEREALLPTHIGTLQLAPVDVVWWNIRTDRLEHARLPGRALQIANNPALAVDTPVSSQASPTPGNVKLWPWQLSTALFALLSLAGWGLWWRGRRRPAIRKGQPSGPSPRTLLDDLKRACQANDPQATRHALELWARQQPENLAQMAARYVPLSAALDGLNGALYSEAGQTWQGAQLWQAVHSLPTGEPSVVASDGSDLPPLYPK